jgi:DNA repair photolyase
MHTIPAKNIISSYREDGWFGSNYTMNIYKGCCHGCIYCDSRSDCYHVDNFDEVRAKEDAVSIIEKDLKRDMEQEKEFGAKTKKQQIIEVFKDWLTNELYNILRTE